MKPPSHKKIAFVLNSRDANYVEISRAYASGKTLTNLHIEYSRRVDRPYCYGAFAGRFQAWRDAGAVDLWTASIPASAPVSAPAPAASPASAAPADLAIARGVAFIDAPGTALQVRRGDLCIRFKDGRERLFPPRAHAFKSLIVAASASISTDAIAWLSAENIALFISTKSDQGFALFAPEPGRAAGLRQLDARRRQFAAVLDERKSATIAVRIVRTKIETQGLSVQVRRELLARLAKARTREEALAVEARAAFLYWQAREGFPLAFKGPAPPAAWRTFGSRNSGRLLKSRRTAMVFSPRAARHPMNAMLNYSYAIALANVARAICAEGLDLTFGFLHAEKRGRLSLAYDVLELLRVAIDEAVFAFTAKRKFERADFVEIEGGTVRLTSKLASALAGEVLRRVTFADAAEAVNAVSGFL